jgi:hypothetical protein
LGENDAQRILGLDHLREFDIFVGNNHLPVRLRLIEAPLHGFGKVFGDLRALNVCGIQVIFEMQRHLCRQSRLWLRLSIISTAEKQQYAGQHY